MNPADLQRLLDTELRRLPGPRAPHTLLPRVLAAVEEWSSRPWYAREWFTWPLGLRVASVAALLVLVAGSGLLWLRLEAILAPAGVAAAALWRTVLEPFASYAVALVMMMGVACAALGAALGQVVREAGQNC